MKKLFLLTLLSLILSKSFAQVSINPNNIGVGPTTNPLIPLHIKKNGEVARFEGTWPYISFYDGITMNGYIQGIYPTFEIGTKNNFNLNFFTGNAQRLSIDGTNGQVTVSQKINANGGLKLTGPLQAQGESVGADGMVLVSKGNATPAWENQKVGFQATFPNGDFTLPPNTFATPTTFTEHWDYDNNFTPSTGTFTVPSDGLYYFDWNFTISLFNGSPAVNQGRCRVVIFVNGSQAIGETSYEYKATMSVGTPSISGFKAIKLFQGDNVQFSIYQTNENNINARIFTNGSAADPIFHGYKIF